MVRDEKQAARFEAKVNRNGPVIRTDLGACWVWTAALDRKGYGQIGWGSKKDGSRRPVGAHRFAWWLATGEMPRLHVLHRCDNPACVRVDHLFLGTNTDNVRDMHSKGRNVVREWTAADRAKSAASTPRGDAHYARRQPERLARGERHGSTRLTREQVLALRAEREAGASLRELAAKYELSEPGVSAIALRRNWAHV